MVRAQRDKVGWENKKAIIKMDSVQGKITEIKEA